MHIHIVAVSGTGMGALAGLLKQLGHDVTGSDVAFDPPMGPALEAWGVRCMHGFDPRHLTPAPDLTIIGNVCRKDNPEARAAIDGGLPYTHIAGALARFALENTSPLVVAGTHGKTTTSALAAWLLDRAGQSPGFLIGGLPKNFKQSFRAPAEYRPTLPTGERPHRKQPFVVEGDEYDTAFFEKSAKFLHYRPEIAIVTSIEHDHIDIYPTLESYLEAFRKFVRLVPEHGLIVANAADPLLAEIVTANARAPIAWFALEGEDTRGLAPHWCAAIAQATASATTFDLYAGGVACGRFALPLAGRHNVKNALAALGAVAQGFGARLSTLNQALATFAGVRRRQDLLGTPRGIAVYDDFAHHPTAVSETLAALRMRHPSGRLFAVFEPRSATACRNIHQNAYAEAFEPASDVLLAPLGRTNVAPEEALNVATLKDALAQSGKNAAAYDSIEAIISDLLKRAEPGDTIALLSNGAFGGIHGKLLHRLEGG